MLTVMGFKGYKNCMSYVRMYLVSIYMVTHFNMILGSKQQLKTYQHNNTC